MRQTEPAVVLHQQDPRFCEARLQLIINTLPATIYFNPAGTVIAGAALYLGGADLGSVPFSRMVAAVGVQCIASLGAWIVWRRHPTAQNVAVVRPALITLQVLIGLCWSTVGWLLWCEGNAANNGFVMIIMVMALWAMALTRCAVKAVFLAGVAAILVPLGVLFVTSDGIAAHIFLALLPIWGWYMVFSGMGARRHVDEMLHVRFAHEDLGKELAAARDEAVSKRLEAETASQSKTSFLANMSHELRTPLNAIIGFSEIIASQALGENNSHYPEYANDIHMSGKHLLTLINDILDVAKIEAGRMEIDPQPIDLSSVLDNVERVMTIRAREKNLQVRFAVMDDAPQPTVDERAFRQILLNLLSNAVKFTPEGGMIDVKCLAGEGGGLLLCVKDSGAGIPAEKLAQLFKPFTQVDNRFNRNQGGTGLGLALVQGLARLHGGRAWLESEVGQGTTAFVYLPLVCVKRDIRCAAH
jgi:two-component system, cell cycle sensor histidine kinase PleC